VEGGFSWELAGGRGPDDATIGRMSALSRPPFPPNLLQVARKHESANGPHPPPHAHQFTVVAKQGAQIFGITQIVEPEPRRGQAPGGVRCFEGGDKSGEIGRQRTQRQTEAPLQPAPDRQIRLSEAVVLALHGSEQVMNQRALQGLQIHIMRIFEEGGEVGAMAPSKRRRAAVRRRC
jgi:hypothetical protein